jgi:hypothetical protein
MGKDSLLESTSKKKTAAKADKEKPAKKKAAAKKATRKKTASKKTAAPKGKKATTAKQAPAKKKATPQKAATAKKSTAPKTSAKKTAVSKAKPSKAKAPAKKKPAVKKPTRKELLSKKFDLYPTGTLYRPPVDAAQAPTSEAPSFFSGMSDDDAKKAKTYLWRQFNWTEIKAAGEKYALELAAKAEAEEAARRKAEEEAQRKAEEEAHRKAEEEAQRKAEEEAQRKAEEEAQRKAEEEARPSAAEQIPPPPAETATGMGSAINPTKIGIIAFCAIIMLLIFSSYSNTKKYYIEEKDGAVEIWRGTFTPMGQTRLMIMPGIQMPPERKDVYAWQDAYRLMYQYYIEKADAILEVPGIPDTAGLTSNLEEAIRYAPNRELRDAARSRLIGIRMQILVNKAQAALNRGTIESATAAIGFLKEAAGYDLTAAEAEMVQRKIEEANAVLADHEKAKAAAEKAAAEKAALEAEAQQLKEASANQPPAAGEAKP